MSRSQPRPKRSLGQNFLVDENIQRRIVQEASVGPGDEVLEIGPGRGALTRHLLELEIRLVLVELDDALARDWKDRFQDDPRIRVIHGDILATDPATLSEDPERLTVVGNIPYNITAPLLFHLLRRPRPRSALLMVQREVADRILAEPGGRQYGALTVGVRSVARVERVLQVPRTAFRPRPRVDSSVVRIVPFRPEALGREEEEGLRRLVRSCFQWRRKKLGKILRDHPDLASTGEAAARAMEREGVDPDLRPEALSPATFVGLSRRLFPQESVG